MFMLPMKFLKQKSWQMNLLKNLEIDFQDKVITEIIK